MAEESASRLFRVTTLLAVVCSLVVSVTAIVLGPKQAVNREVLLAVQGPGTVIG